MGESNADEYLKSKYYVLDSDPHISFYHLGTSWQSIEF